MPSLPTLPSLPSPKEIVSLIAGGIIIAWAIFLPGFRNAISDALIENERLRARR